MRHQVTKDMLKTALRELEIRMGLEDGTLAMDKAPGRGGWIVTDTHRKTTPFSDLGREARDMLATLIFANNVLHTKAWHERERMLRDEG